MYLFVCSFAAAVIGGLMALRYDEHRALYLAVCVSAAVAALVSGIRLIPEAVWMAYSPHIWGVLLVIAFWTLRSNVRRMLLN